MITSDILPDDILLEIFHFYVDGNFVGDSEWSEKRITEEWITLAHVCRRWRNVVFQSPRRLNLRLFCTPETPARDTLDIWPPLPLIISDPSGCGNAFEVDDISAVLEHTGNDRVCEIILIHFSSSEWEYFTNLAAMQEPFPELTDLLLNMGSYKLGSIVPDSILGGTAPRLRSVHLDCVPFPGSPKLLLSATHLVSLELWRIPRPGYIPREVMTTSLSALTSLESLVLDFQHPRPRPALESRRLPLPPSILSILPSLTSILFSGASEYSEEILARIDAPRLDFLYISFFNQIIFDTPQLSKFVGRRPTLRSPEEGYIEFDSTAISVRFPTETTYYALIVKIKCTTSEWQLSSLGQACNSSLPPVSTLKDLYISEASCLRPRWQDDVENELWLEVLHPFTAVKNLYLCKKFVPRVAPALQELVGARTTEVLPTLENIFLEGFEPSGPLEEGIEKFVTARQLTNRSVTVSHWDRAVEVK